MACLFSFMEAKGKYNKTTKVIELKSSTTREVEGEGKGGGREGIRESNRRSDNDQSILCACMEMM
jgi:hypothetical protein